MNQTKPNLGFTCYHLIQRFLRCDKNLSTKHKNSVRNVRRVTTSTKLCNPNILTWTHTHMYRDTLREKFYLILHNNNNNNKRW